MTNPHKFEKHLFISYAHMDNQPLTPEQQGWISRFHASLEVMLSMRLGHTAEIWRDQKLSGNDVYRWKKQYAGLDSDQAKQLKQLQEENERLERQSRELLNEIALLKDML